MSERTRSDERMHWPWLPWDGRGFPPEALVLLLVFGTAVFGLYLWNVAAGVLACIPLAFLTMLGMVLLTERTPE